jgi:hypothetical protein
MIYKSQRVRFTFVPKGTVSRPELPWVLTVASDTQSKRQLDPDETLKRFGKSRP